MKWFEANIMDTQEEVEDNHTIDMVKLAYITALEPSSYSNIPHYNSNSFLMVAAFDFFIYQN
jgi:hypothetical protein